MLRGNFARLSGFESRTKTGSTDAKRDDRSVYLMPHTQTTTRFVNWIDVHMFTFASLKGCVNTERFVFHNQPNTHLTPLTSRWPMLSLFGRNLMWSLRPQTEHIRSACVPVSRHARRASSTPLAVAKSRQQRIRNGNFTNISVELRVRSFRAGWCVRLLCRWRIWII